ncbi:nitroreductase family deazaflavin-dependent oxidoreductase [Streptomyces sp. KM273126]|uniref:nitroreductase/quinone reductase family protein n=1 Tax=Streptomyces sp. KM273126 TaxID=2545247 RepID=UPI001039B928|nr:nitroreductase/quinone reductase family protein [Streptomyces sp. KM273126]MBA2811382.1 nitroreductase family deazaflavin-dependent oxidoreductase [Streptomyces sp. KM273126]
MSRTTDTVDDWKPPPVAIARAANRIVRPLLMSPLHVLVSRRLMLLEYTGRRTGTRYRIPVAYRPWGDDCDEILATSVGTGWPVNLRGGRPVRLRLRGRWRTAEPRVVEDSAQVADLLGDLAERQGPRAVAALRVGLPGDRQPTRDELLLAGSRVRVGRFRITG